MKSKIKIIIILIDILLIAGLIFFSKYYIKSKKNVIYYSDFYMFIRYKDGSYEHGRLDKLKDTKCNNGDKILLMTKEELEKYLRTINSGNIEKSIGL